MFLHVYLFEKWADLKRRRNMEGGEGRWKSEGRERDRNRSIDLHALAYYPKSSYVWG